MYIFYMGESMGIFNIWDPSQKDTDYPGVLATTGLEEFSLAWTENI